MLDKLLNISDPELEKRLALEAKLANYRKEIVAANLEEAKLRQQAIENRKAEEDIKRTAFKGPEVKVLDGKISATNNFVETQILANRCVSKLVSELVNSILNVDIFKKEDMKFVFYNASDFQSIELYLSFVDQLTVLSTIFQQAIAAGKDSLDDVLKAAGGFAPMVIGMAAAGLLRTAADIFSLFKTSSTIANYDIASDESLLISSFSNKLKEKAPNFKVYYPVGYPIYLTGFPENKSSEFIGLFSKLKDISLKAIDVQTNIENKLALIDTQLLESTDDVEKSKLERRKIILKACLPDLQSAIAAFSQLEILFLAIDPNTKLSLRSIVLQAEKLVSVLNSENSYIIKLSTKLNGSTWIKESLFKITTIKHSGGAHLSCLVFAKDGSILFSDNRDHYTPYKRSLEIK